MKRIQLSIVMLLFVGCASYEFQDYPAAKIHQIPGGKKSQLFNASKSWLASNVGKINFSDPNDGKIVVDGTAFAYDGFSRQFTFLMSVYIKDGRIMTEYTNVQLNPSYNAYIKPYIDKAMDEIVNKLIVHLGGNPTNW